MRDAALDGDGGAVGQHPRKNCRDIPCDVAHAPHRCGLDHLDRYTSSIRPKAKEGREEGREDGTRNQHLLRQGSATSCVAGPASRA